jgi:competence protein ComGC
LNYRLTKAFTLIEVIISVIILSTSIILVLQIHSQTRKDIEYIVQRNKYALQDSLFVSNKIAKYNKDTKSAYDVLTNKFHVDKLKSKEILQNIKRKIYVPQAQIIKQDTIGNMPSVEMQEIKIKNQFSSNYFSFTIK